MLLKDLQFALRMLTRNPGFTALAVLTLGVGLGMTMTVWGVIDRVLLDPLPYPEGDRIVEIRMAEPGGDPTGFPMSVFAFQDIVDRSRSFESLAVSFKENINLTGGSSPARVRGARVSSGFFDVMAVRPQVGRDIRPDEDVVGGEPVAVLGYRLWHTRYGGTPDILGQKVMVDGRPHTVIGVAPDGFSFPGDVEIWLPISIEWTEEDRNHGWVVGYGRLKPQNTLTEASADLERISAWQQAEFPEIHEGRTLVATPIKEIVVGAVRSSLDRAPRRRLLCALDRGGQCHDSVVGADGRPAAGGGPASGPGATRGRLVRQLVSESTLLALTGGVVGLAFAHWATGVVRLRFAEFIPRSDNLGLDLGAIAVAAGLSLAVGCAVGAVTAMRTREASHHDPAARC